MTKNNMRMKTGFLACVAAFVFVAGLHAKDHDVAINGNLPQFGTEASPFRAGQHAEDATGPGVAIFCPANASFRMRLAAHEIRRYVYLRTGELLPIAKAASDKPDRSHTACVALRTESALGAQAYRLQGDGTNLTITGGSDVGVLYGAYAFA